MTEPRDPISNCGRSRQAAGSHDRRFGGGDRGVALVAVLWVTALLALLASGIGASSRTDVRLAYNDVEHAKAKAAADGGAHRALFELLTNVDGLTWQGGIAGDRSMSDDDGVRVLIRDEDAKLDVNEISPDLWQRLLSAVGLDDEAALALADRIIAFRGTDQGAGTSGADVPGRTASALSREAPDRRFLATSELLHVTGMTGEIYRRLQPHITIYAEVEGIDYTRASRIALQTLPGMTLEAAQSIATTTPGSDPLLALSDSVIAEIEPYLLPSRDLFFSIESLGVSEGGGRFVREVIVALDSSGRSLPVTVHAWRQGHAASIPTILSAAR